MISLPRSVLHPLRYERELNGGVRPPLRLIATQDAPAAYPMVLCISNVTWSESGLTDDGVPTEPHPELEVTDGWYRLRAQVDAPLARAIRKGIIRIGRKIGVAGARVCVSCLSFDQPLINTASLAFFGKEGSL